MVRRKLMPMLGILTNLLDSEYKAEGYVLTEDEDFLYLYSPGNPNPYVFSSHGVTIDTIHGIIEVLKRKNPTPY